LAERRRALLCDEPGLGKTLQAIMACDHVEAARVLVLAPAAVTTNWQREFMRWQRISRHVSVIGAGDLSFGVGVHIASYDRARQRPTLNALLARPWDVLVADEAHYLKNREAARTLAVMKLEAGAGHGWGLTGTPMPNSADELWPLLRMFGPEALGGLAYYPFRKRYCVEIPLGSGRFARSKIVGVKNAEALRTAMEPVLLRRKKVDVLKDLPPLREGELALSPGEHLAEIDAACADPEMEALIKSVMAATLLSDDVEKHVQQMLQSASANSISRLRRVTAAVKVRALAPLLAEELRGHGDKLVVMGWHRETLDVLEDALAAFGPVRLDGQTPQNRRQAAIDSFQSDLGTRVFLGQIQAAGTGITLTAAADLVFAEMSWTPSDNAQAAMRVHRVGQTRPVLIRYATLAGTVDEAVIRTLRRKTQDIRNVLN
jgi:SWI/SNF-related matrix-associated actin-dependent regulator 1 of chromatin subfamily A